MFDGAVRFVPSEVDTTDTKPGTTTAEYYSPGYPIGHRHLPTGRQDLRSAFGGQWEHEGATKYLPTCQVAEKRAENLRFTSR